MGRGKKKVQNKLLPKVLQLEQALGGNVERQVIIDVLKSVGEDPHRAMELLVQMVEEPVATTQLHDASAAGSSECDSGYHAPLETKDDDGDDKRAPGVRSGEEENSSSGLSEQQDSNWTMLTEMFKGLLSVDELANLYFMQNCDLESTVASALNTVDDDCGDNAAIFDELATNSDYYFQHSDVVMDSVLQALASLTSEQSAVVETLERIFPDHEVSVMLGVAETVNFDLDQAVAVLLDGHTVEAAQGTPAWARGSKSSRTYAEAMAGQQAGSLISKLANPAKKEEEFPELRPATGVSTSNQSSNDTSSAGLSIADRLKLRQLYLTYPSCSRGTIRQLYLSNDRSAHNVMTILGFSQPGLSARVTSRQSPPPPLAPVTSPGSNTSSSSATPSVRTGTTDSRTDEDTTESKRNGRKGNYVPWTVVDSGRKQKKQQPQRYIPGLNQPDDVVTPETNTEAYWREQAVFAKQRMRESFLQAAQLRRELGGDAAHEAAARGQEFKDLMHLYNSRAAACTIRDRNEGVHADVVGSMGSVCYRSPQTSDGSQSTSYVRVDLHGLFVREAVQFLASLIDQYSAKKAKVTVDAITGVGNNSQGGRARLMEATTRLLRQKQLPYQVNNGTVRFKT